MFASPTFDEQILDKLVLAVAYVAYFYEGLLGIFYGFEFLLLEVYAVEEEFAYWLWVARLF